MSGLRSDGGWDQGEAAGGERDHHQQRGVPDQSR